MTNVEQMREAGFLFYFSKSNEATFFFFFFFDKTVNTKYTLLQISTFEPCMKESMNKLC